MEASEIPSCGTTWDMKNSKGDGNSDTIRHNSIGTAQVAIIVVTTFLVAAALSALLTLAIGCLCLKLRQQLKNKSELTPDPIGSKPEDRSSNSIIAAVDFGACEEAGMIRGIQDL